MDQMTDAPAFTPDAPEALPLRLVAPDTLEDTLAQLAPAARAFAQSTGFAAQAGEVLPLPGPEGTLAGALMGLGTPRDHARSAFAPLAGVSRLPAGLYRLQEAGGYDPTRFALGWLLESYRFTRYAPAPAPAARLIAPDGVDAQQISRMAAAECLARDLINTPAEDLGPDELEQAARHLARTQDAAIEVTTGADLLEANLPLIHAVGRAAARAPRLIDIRWGTEGPQLTLVGKGIVFDTGGLNVKPGASMGLMKKDMGGAAHVLATARAIMESGWRVRLRVLIPVAENAISGNAMRPGDILTARTGQTIEVNNTDAEGRLVLADALALAAEEHPDLIVSMATLTGAARVALGPDIAPFFAIDDGLAARLSEAGQAEADPVWRLPFFDGYEPQIEPGIAHLDNAPKGGMAGAITAALFLRRFTADLPYAHFDVYGWRPSATPARPKGGTGQGWRALFAALPGYLDL